MSMGSMWLIRLTYGHSTHIVEISLHSVQMIWAPMNLTAPIVALFSLILMAVTIMLAIQRRNHKRIRYSHLIRC